LDCFIEITEKSFHLLLLLATADFQGLNISEIAISHSPRSQLNLFAECKNFVFQHRCYGSFIMNMSLIQNYIDGWRILTFHEPKQLSEVHLESDIKGQC